VLYGDDDFEELVHRYLRDDARRERVARAGHARVRGHTMAQRLEALRQVLAAPGPGRPRADAHALHLGRGNALAMTWADPAAAFPEFLAAHRARPDDPRPLNGLALAMLRRGAAQFLPDAARLLQQAVNLNRHYVPAIANLAWLVGMAKLADPTPCLNRLGEVLRAPRRLEDFDGLALAPAHNLELGAALVEAVRAGRVTEHLERAWVAAAGGAAATVSCP
jgi:hypothetical protein